mmetsp:Transcript_8281/g.18510  ORF Transcript_8281/g.18510 Transcript_8281/m.18510 type:complete len:223 (+) Transcript_8281:91-759(+)|eukprot:CAMPEP_0178405350 /NCGR_PEP_ID=MMETSP0689_2-20121128/18353_1 /TAXON_ID=160604 /ORGANISM="Amphidinium massartii, Strain CS-259" /LENGTH=222 /DNA_ID=CAMNT_0020026361 /DNA_START=68 /DNA_END=736 /DNA_ORIENTATION=-
METDKADLSELYQKALSTKTDLEKDLEKFRQESKTGSPSTALQQRLSALSAEFSRLVESVRQEASEAKDKSKKASWDRKVEKLEEAERQIQGELEKSLGQFFRRTKAEEDRKALFGDKDGKKAQSEDGMQSQLNERKRLEESNNMLDDIIGQGRSVLDNLIGQNKMLKNARRKLLDAANIMGVSASLVGVIDRRQTTDKLLVYGGMAFTLFLLLSLWYLLRW